MEAPAVGAREAEGLAVDSEAREAAPLPAEAAPAATTAPLAPPPSHREVLRPLEDALIRRALAFSLRRPSPRAAPPASPAARLLLRARAALAAGLRWLSPPRGLAAAGFPSDGEPPGAGVAEARYLPTGALRLLDSLGAALPGGYGLWLADFDALPPPALDAPRSLAEDARIGVAQGVRCGALPDPGYFPAAAAAPLVASKGGPARRTRDHANYLAPHRGRADIFFPTDFQLLRDMVLAARAEAAAARAAQRAAGADVGGGGQGAAVAGGGGEGAATAGGGGHGASAGTRVGGACTPEDDPSVRVRPSAEFLMEHAEVARTATISGWNPMLQDYLNTAVLTADLPRD